MKTSQLSLNSAVQYLTNAVFAEDWGPRPFCGGIRVFSCYCFIILMYHAATAPVFLLTRMIYMHLLGFRCTEYVYILLNHRFAEIMTQIFFFPATGLEWKEELVFFFFFVTKQRGHMNHVEFVPSVSLSDMSSSFSPSSRPSVH